MQFYAFHGCLPEEAAIGTNYEVDVRVESNDLQLSVKSDDLNDTIDYVKVQQLCKQAMQERSNLIEHVAGRILSSLVQQFGKHHIFAVTVHKFNPPMNAPLHKVSFTVSNV